MKTLKKIIPSLYLNMIILLFIFMFVNSLFAQRNEKIFYATNDEICFQSFKNNYQLVDVIAPQCYYMDENGTIWGLPDARVIELAKKNKIKIMPLIMNPKFDQPMFHKFLMNKEAQKRSIRIMTDLCRENNYYGIQFDFENIHITDREPFTEYYRNTANALHKEGFIISIAVVPRLDNYPGPTSYHKWIYEYWRGVYDLKELVNIGDFISLMTYDQHTTRTTPGPVSGINWMEKCLQFALKEVPPDKISLGIPFYSYCWYPQYEGDKAYPGGSYLSYPNAKGKAEKNNADLIWSEKEKVYYTFYENQGLYEYIYFEESRSIKTKIELAQKYKLLGYSVWRLGDEDPEVWKIIK